MILLARAGSSRIPGKNFKDFCGKPLIEWTLEFMEDFEFEKYVFTDSKEVREICKLYDVKVRDKILEGGEHRTREELIEYNKKIEADIIILLQATSPFRNRKLLEDGLKNLISNGYGCAFSVTKESKQIYYSNGERVNKARSYDDENYFYFENGSFYIFKKEQLEKAHVTDGKPIFCVDKYDIDLDTEKDWKRAEILYHGGYYEN
jgi:N-acylneuraminate cytidylyltransferase